MTNVRSLGIDRAAFNQGQNAKFGFTVCEEQITTLTARGPSAVCAADPNDRVVGTITGDGDKGATLQQLASGVFAYDRKAECYDMTHANDVIRECGGTVPTLQARMGTGGNQVPLVLDGKPRLYNTSLTYGAVTEGEVCRTLSAQMDNQTDLPIVLQENGNDRFIGEGFSPTLKTTTVPNVCTVDDRAICIRENTIGRAKKNGGNGLGVKEESAYTITTAGPHGVMTKARVRRLTPLECERLMGFKDDWTKVPYRGKPAEKCPDAPRYKACGNSMCVNVMRWIGQRIQMVEDGVLG